MRRLLLLCLLLMLPFQGTWAAVTAIDALDAPCADLQLAALHTDHAGDGAATADLPDTWVDCDGGLPAETCGDGNCSNCHGHGLSVLVGMSPVVGGNHSGGRVLARCVRGAPDHIPEHLLRPPLSPLA